MAIMRLKRGIKVEVWRKSEASLGSWRCAEVISGNGHTYEVKHESYQPGMAAETERVSRKFIRPLSPSVVGLTNWTPGDIVEAFENHSWKHARVSSVAVGDYYFVRIIGSCKLIIAHKSELRVQQSWEDNHWVIIRKDSSRFKDSKVIRRSNVAEDFNHHTAPPTRKVKVYEVPLKEHHGLEVAQRKRRSVCMAPVELRKHASMNHREFGSTDALEGNDTHRISSSVGSCSPCGGVYSSSCHLTTCPTQDKSPDHHLELHAYHCTKMALYSSEHLTWEQEAFLTQLRLQLRISNDEHLAELKHLASAQSDRQSYA
ncbi:uncharacterized protein LOC120104576 [Phoenix dactylifera]|uniref:Uncharacterized protein LOC120104576 n=1 Tax=Phoenix dactylifera TaxID=42345 RepID=A0A8B8ZJG4_PHODC|nr:uncharacterized protein LOC120104576 [Phoenix dactylifera]